MKRTESSHFTVSEAEKMAAASVPFYREILLGRGEAMTDAIVNAADLDHDHVMLVVKAVDGSPQACAIPLGSSKERVWSAFVMLRDFMANDTGVRFTEHGK